MCPRCGKCLSTEQALSYHLSKKYKCGTWKCIKCGKSFDSKFQLQIHELSCLMERVHTPSYDILRNFYLKSPILFVKGDDKVESMSPYCKDILGYEDEEIIGTKNEPIHSTGYISRKMKNGETVNLKRIHIYEDYFIEIPENINVD